MIRKILRFVSECGKNRSLLGVPFWNQFQDFLFFHRTTGMSPNEFHLFRLWDRRRPIEDRLAYLSHEEHREIEAALNPRLAVNILNDKIATAARLRNAGIRMPRMLGHIKTKTAEGAVRDTLTIAAELAQLASNDLPHGFAIKPNNGKGGKNIHIFSAANANGVSRPDGSHITLATLASQLNHKNITLWNVEERLIPHPVLASLAPEALSTIRVLTFKSPAGAIHVGPATIKVPVGQNVVDNFCAGNIAAPVHLTTGRVGKGVKFNMEKNISLHPTSGQVIDTITVPDIEAVKHLVTQAAMELKELNSLGWDVALTPDGPVILEGNAWWSHFLVQMPHGEGIVRGEFGTLLEAHGLGRLLRKREHAAESWRLNRKPVAN